MMEGIIKYRLVLFNKLALKRREIKDLINCLYSCFFYQIKIDINN